MKNQAKLFEVKCVRRGGVHGPRYESTIKRWAFDEKDAEKKALKDFADGGCFSIHMCEVLEKPKEIKPANYNRRF